MLDTQVFIWWMESNKRLPRNINLLINDPQNTISISVASAWEMVIKRQKGKLRVPKDIEGGIKAGGFSLLPIELEHVLRIEKLPLFHKDPFDRILISQAQIEYLTLISNDRKIWRYKIDVLKC